MIKSDHGWPRVSETPKSTKRVSFATYLFKRRAWLRLGGMYAWAIWLGAGFIPFSGHAINEWQFWAFLLPLLLLMALRTAIVTDASCSGRHHE